MNSDTATPTRTVQTQTCFNKYKDMASQTTMKVRSIGVSCVPEYVDNTYDA